MTCNLIDSDYYWVRANGNLQAIPAQYKKYGGDTVYEPGFWCGDAFIKATAVEVSVRISNEIELLKV